LLKRVGAEAAAAVTVTVTVVKALLPLPSAGLEPPQTTVIVCNCAFFIDRDRRRRKGGDIHCITLEFG
jgi:hypothetical protein